MISVTILNFLLKELRPRQRMTHPATQEQAGLGCWRDWQGGKAHPEPIQPLRPLRGIQTRPREERRLPRLPPHSGGQAGTQGGLSPQACFVQTQELLVHLWVGHGGPEWADVLLQV